MDLKGGIFRGAYLRGIFREVVFRGCWITGRVILLFMLCSPAGYVLIIRLIIPDNFEQRHFKELCCFIEAQIIECGISLIYIGFNYEYVTLALRLGRYRTLIDINLICDSICYPKIVSQIDDVKLCYDVKHKL